MRARLQEEVVIFFSSEDMAHIVKPHNDALVITTKIMMFDVKQILVDGGNSSNILFLKTLKKCKEPMDT